MRKLASIQTIDNITPIPDADRIMTATILGWEVVIRKNEFNIGDKCVYVECDTILPFAEWSEFLRDEKRINKPIRIRIRRMKGQVSQGLVMPLSILPEGTSTEIGTDVTTILGIEKHDPQLVEESTLNVTHKSKSKVLKFFMGFAPFRKVYFALNTTYKGNFPDWVGGKTDEERVQTCIKLLREHEGKSFYVTEKLDGQSATYFYHKCKKWGFDAWEYGVCSRNIWLKTKSQSNYWQVSDQYGIDKIFKKDDQETVIQGEICGGKIQKNKYKIDGLKFFVFNVKINGVQLSIKDMVQYCKERGLEHVPVLDYNYILPIAPIIGESGEGKDFQHTVRKMVDYSEGNSVLYKTKREGIVVRLNENPRVSFKVINPKFLLAEKDD